MTGRPHGGVPYLISDSYHFDHSNPLSLKFKSPRPDLETLEALSTAHSDMNIFTCCEIRKPQPGTLSSITNLTRTALRGTSTEVST